MLGSTMVNVLKRVDNRPRRHAMLKVGSAAEEEDGGRRGKGWGHGMRRDEG